MSKDPVIDPRLYCPGPTPIPLDVQIASLNGSIYHRSAPFQEITQNCRKLLAPFFNGDQLPLILTASGTGAMEAAIANFTSAGEKVVAVNAGKFGERWTKLCKRFLCETLELQVPWGKVPSPADVAAAVTKHNATALCIQANETSTGAVLPVEAIAKEVRQAKPDIKIFVDAISYLVAHPMKMTEWGIDVVVAGSQKGFGTPAGLAFIAYQAKLPFSDRPRFYFDLQTEAKNQIEGKTAWTPAIQTILGLEAALKRIHSVGVEAITKHHANLANACRAGVKALGLKLFAAESPSNALTAIEMPDLDPEGLRKQIATDFGFVIAGGQDDLKGKILRLSHLGLVSRFHVLDGLAAIEFALAQRGRKDVLGTGVAAAMRAFHDACATP
jgi:aspartate aminotransferase-like enzyme